MIRAKGRMKDGRPLLLLGLSGENLARLVAGEPIRFDAAELALPACEVVLMYGRTEDDIRQAIIGHGITLAG